MSDIDIFTIDDDFDPLEEIDFEPPSAEEQYLADYMAPIPDADKSIVPDPVVLTPDEKIAKLLKGLPGQEYRILSVVRAAAGNEPRLAEDIIAEVDSAFPNTKSVYDTARVLRLLKDAEALEAIGRESGAPIVEKTEDYVLTEDNFVYDETGERYLVVAENAPSTYRATTAGMAAVDQYFDAEALKAIIDKEPRYAPLYARIMSMVSEEGGATTPQLNGAIDPDPLCEEPRRYCSFFTDKLETAGLIEWRGEAWFITELGREALATGTLDEY